MERGTINSIPKKSFVGGTNRVSALGTNFVTEDKYKEKPRANLLNSVSAIKSANTAVQRILYVAKINDADGKGEIEKELTSYFKSLADGKEITGLLVILGGYCIHFLEADHEYIFTVMKLLKDEELAPASLYKKVNVIAYTEENPTRAFKLWFCKTLFIQGGAKDTKQRTTFDRASSIYNNMCTIGSAINAVMSKGSNAMSTTLKSQASELLPAGEELNLLLADKYMSIHEFLDFHLGMPDIVLERDLVWPVEPRLTY